MRSSDEVRRWLAGTVAELLGEPARRIDARASFRSHGLDSAAAAILATKLSAWIGLQVPLTALWEHPSIVELAAHVVSEARPQALAARVVAGDEPVAIVGLACRFPGGASSPGSLWRLLCDGVDAIAPIPPGRLDLDALARLEAATGEATAREGGFLGAVDGFDPLFFGLSPREAALSDPQQRVMLELAWEALEDAGVAAGSLVGSPTGVFVGALWHDFASLLARAGLAAIEQHTATGLSHAVIANRISYALGLEGPSMAVDTACSASLVAVHLACESLRRGESTLALAGGVNLILAPDSMVQMARFGARSPTGRCRSFDAAGDGYVRAEGAGLVALEPLGRALAAGRRIYGLVRGSAINNDGRSNGLTAPNPRAQRAVLAAACARAGVEPASVDYVEAHGTGTRLGDPIEASALAAVYGPGRARPLRIGSIKTNVGHTEAAAGIAGLMKTALALHHRVLPASLHFRTPNPDIDFTALKLAVQDRREAWPESDGPARAGVSSFGFGGTNAHALLEAPPRPLRVVALAAASAAERVALAGEAAVRLANGGEIDRPSDAPFRLAIVGPGAAAMGEGLAAFGRGEAAPGLWIGEAVPRRPVLVFSGQGGQWLGMGRALLADSPAARAVLLACDRLVAAEVGWSLLDELWAPPQASRLREADVVQPLLFAVQVAIAAAWQAQGVVPRAIVGHSAGEVAAAHVAGVLDLADAVRVICLRGRLTRRIAGRGGVMLVERAAAEVEALLVDHAGVTIAAHNSPQATVVSGDRAALERLAEACRRSEIGCAMVEAAYAAHGPQVEPLLAEMVAGLDGVVAMPTQVPLISTVTGAAIDGRALGPTYWARNLRAPVAFAAAVEGLARAGADLFLETGPHPVLVPSLQQCLAGAGQGGRAIASMRRDGPGAGALTAAAAELWTLGVRIAAVEGREAAGDEAPRLVPVSAHSREALRERVAGLVAALTESAAPGLDDLGHTAALGRDHLAHRVAVVADTTEGLRERLAGALASGADAGAPVERPPRIALVFPGQGGAWAGMGRELLASEPAFRRALYACDAAIERHAGFSVAEALLRGEATDEAARLQPLLFAVQVALARTWAAYGVEPVAVVGHSMGEVAAAHVAGALGLDEAARLIVRRSRQIGALVGRGTMALVEATPATLEPALARYPGRVSVAARNSPRSFLLAGEAAALAAIVAEFQAAGAFARLTGLPFPIHCALSRPIAGALAQDLAGITPRCGQIPIYSTLLGRPIDGAEMDADYWLRHALEPVRFHEQTRALLDDGVDVLLEVGPHPVLAHACEQTIAEHGAPALVLASLRRGGGRAHLLEVLARLYQRGLAVAWPAVLPRGGSIVSLPTYPFQRRRLWPAALAGGAIEVGPTGAEAPAQTELAALAAALGAKPSTPQIEQFLRAVAGELLALSPSALSPTLSLRRLGLDSLGAMRLANRVREALRVEAPAPLFLADRSLAALALALAERAAQGRGRVASAGELAAAMEEEGL
ncbi:type I polyketide synthase [Nannocystis bainbridge]|uniref:Acyltransferase domain-containing protein n=1 Tax=Nannocystis bainbridge TaxID=2995303 RepID=A0ABT5DV67_9BACT|nr:acyltransferase domain-containing protein [Nannocystis bainbridge]MDC0717535.1 acyltransferase domain-containing protein [Nannocystis bainbridge]